MRRETVRQAVRFVLASWVAFLGFALPSLTGCGGSSTPPPLSVTAMASTTTVDGGDTATLTAAVANDKNSAGVSWTISGGALSNTTTTSATFTAPAATGAAQTVTATATSIADATKTATVSLTIPAAPSLTTASLASGAVGTAYSVTLAGIGGIAPYSWTITSGTLPAGLSFASSTGVLSGTPVASSAGTANLTFKVTDSGVATALTASKALSLTIAAAPAITFSMTSLAGATYNTAYTAAVAATGGAGALTYSLASGSLPAGLSLSAAGAISGTPAAGGSFSFAVKAADGYGDTATQSYSLTVTYPAITLSPSATALTATFGKAYTQSFTASGGSGSGYTFSITTGASALSSAGLSFSGGALSGTPSATGPIPFTVRVTDSASNTASLSYTLTISYAALTITPTSFSTGVVNSPYLQTLAASGGSGSGYSWSITTGSSNLTALGLGFSGNSISGTPTVSGSATFTVQVQDSASNQATQSYTITVNASLGITSSTLPSAAVGSTYSTTLAASGGTGPYTWSIAGGSSAPAGLSLGVSGVLSGTPTTASGGSPTTFVVQATDSASHTANATLSITINAAIGTTSPTTLPSGYVGTAYSQTLTASGGSGTGYSWSVASGSSLPSWASLSAAGVLSGTPSTSGTSTFTLKLTDSASNAALIIFSLSINAALSITTTALSAATVNAPYAQTINTSGGTGGYTFSISSGSLPSWATLNSSTGKISGTPGSANAGSTTFTVKVTDSASHSATQQLTLSVFAISGTNDSYLSGHYAFYAIGWVDGTNVGNTYKVAMAGSFVADGAGNISSGTLDYNDAVNGAMTNLSLTGTYALPSNNIGQMVLTLSNGSTITRAFNVGGITSGVATGGDWIRFDDTTGIGTPGGTRFSGEFALQTASSFTTASLTGGYVFGLDGETCPLSASACNSATDHGPLAAAGVMTLSGAGLVSHGEEDIAMAANFYSAATFSGNYGTPNSSTGRTILTLSAGSALPSSDSNIWPRDLVIYIVDSTKFYVLSTDSHTNYALLAGKAEQQTVSSFSTANFNGSSILWGVSPSDNYVANWGTSSAVSLSSAIVARFVATSSSATANLTLQENNEGTLGSMTGSGSYTVASNGRTTFVVGGNPPVLYLSATNTGIAVQTGGNPALLFLEPQTSTTVGGGSYIFGNLSPVPQSSNSLGAGTVGSGNFSLISSDSDSGGSLTWDQSVSGTYSVDSTGLITFSDGAVGYVISASKLIHLDSPGSNNTSPSLSVVQQ